MKTLLLSAVCPVAACGDNVRGDVTVDPGPWGFAVGELVSMTPYGGLSIGTGGAFGIAVVDDDAVPLEGYRVEPDAANHWTVHAHDVLGAQYGVAGALEKEVVLHPFLGNVARRLVREANCSVMLFTHPQKKPKPLRRIVFIADHPQQGLVALRTALMLAEAEACERLYVIGIITSFDEARASIAGDATPNHGEEDPLEEFVLSAGATEVPIETRSIRVATGLAASDFVRSVEADLLVVPLPKSRETVQQLPSNIAWVSDVIPCNLWIVR